MSGPDQWGPHGWKFIHYVTMGYPDKPTKNDKIRYKNFLTAIGDVLPCIICANHYKEHLLQFPLDDKVLKNRTSLMSWGVRVHNAVNENNNKKIYSVKDGIKNIKSNDDTCDTMEHFEENSSNSLIYIFPIILFGLIICYQLYLMKLKKK